MELQVYFGRKRFFYSCSFSWYTFPVSLWNSPCIRCTACSYTNGGLRLPYELFCTSFPSFLGKASRVPATVLPWPLGSVCRHLWLTSRGRRPGCCNSPPPHTQDSPMGKDCPTWMAEVLRLRGPGLPCNLHHSSVTTRGPSDGQSLTHTPWHTCTQAQWPAEQIRSRTAGSEAPGAPGPGRAGRSPSQAPTTPSQGQSLSVPSSDAQS